jgi:SMC interacting uncharacterized protein involved in chromosome segregation
MSVADVIENAKAWLAAIENKERLEAAFRGEAGMVVYREWLEAIEKEKKAARAHLASVIDLPHDGVHDDERIARLRTENARLAEQVKALKREVTEARRNNEERNRELDALHYVWCDGGCKGGAHRYCGRPDDITEEIVAAAERNTMRLRRWFVNREHKKVRNE